MEAAERAVRSTLCLSGRLKSAIVVERLEETLVGGIPFFEGFLRYLLAVLAEPTSTFYP